MQNSRTTAGETATRFEEEGRRRAELVRKALEEGRMIHFRWNKDGSGCEFHYKGIDNHGMPCTFSSSLNVANSIFVFCGIYIYPVKEGGER